MNELPILESPRRTGAAMKRGSSKQDYSTPPDFMDAVTRRFGDINFDLAASAQNTKHSQFFSIEDDSLCQKWHKLPGWLWLNPPFDNIAEWAKKCREEYQRGACILFLTPASIGSNWFADHVYGQAAVYALQGRLHFDPEHPTWAYPKDCMLSIYYYGITGFKVWKWKPWRLRGKAHTVA